MHRRIEFAAFVAAFLLTGCGANYTTAYRTFEPVEGNPKNALIDAKQRALFVAPGTSSYGNEGEIKRSMLVCAEPSPDALSAISSSLSASFSGLFPSGQQVQAALSRALAETASQLGVRNATIQLLRDGLYRQCEAYMNGLIDKYYYEQIANKYVNAMVALLAIEQLAPVGANAAIVNAGENATVNTTAETDITQSAAAPAGSEGDTTAGTPAAGGDGGTENGGTGSANTGGTAAAPTTSVVFPAPNQRETQSHVSRAVGAMVTWFLTKDTVDYCLRSLRELQSGESVSLSTPFVQVCKTVIENQMTQQGEYLSGLVTGDDGTDTFSNDECSSALLSFWQPGGIINQQNFDKIDQEMKRLSISVSLPLMINGEKQRENRRRVGSALGLPKCKSA